MAEPKLNRDAPDFIPVAKPSIGRLEMAYMESALKRNQLSQGPYVAKFEREFAAAHGRNFGIACNSGTSALHLALVCAGVKPDDVVAVPDHTMIAVANAVIYCGAKLVLIGGGAPVGNAEFRESLWMINSRCSLAIVVHTYGVFADLFAFGNWRLIEDCAEAHYVPGVGRQGRFACFSFYANKIITTAEGGMVLCDSPDDAERLRSLRAHAFSFDEHFKHTELAFGYRMTELQGALGCAQHERREELIAGRIRAWQAYPMSENRAELRWVAPLLVRDREQRDGLREHLAAHNIETRTYFRPLSQQPHVRPHIVAQIDVERSQSLASRGLYLPLYSDLQPVQVERIMGVVNSFKG